MFKEITGYEPYPWQRRLYNMFVNGNIPDILDIPTGLGKTSIICIWLIALYNYRINNTKTRIPLRLVYIVDRRVIVDQASDEVKKIQLKIKDVMGDKMCLNVSTLRGGGGMADSREWLKNPNSPAIIIGTVDMIGSRLFFSGYGISNKVKSFYAGLLGQDSLIILDETHLSPALDKSLQDMKTISQNVKEEIFPPKICLMSATQDSSNNKNRFKLDDDDLHNSEIKKRYKAEKHLHLVNIEDNNIPSTIAEYAQGKKGRILIYLQKPKDVQSVKEIIEKKHKAVMLTGTLRGWERDALIEDDTYKSFLSSGKYDKEDPLFLISTSAGEVGVDFDADHMLCDITTFDSLVQRLGRVNRTGGRISDITVIYSDKLIKKNNSISAQLKKTKDLFEDMIENDTYNASPYNIARINAEDKKEASTPKPEMQPLTKEVLDMWAMTSIYDKYPSRPAVHYWLRGKPEYQIPDTYVAWREDTKYLAKVSEEKIEDVLESYRILSHEIARNNSDEVYKLLKNIKPKNGQDHIIIIDQNGRCSIKRVGEVVKDDLNFATILLSPDMGGLDKDGFLSTRGKNVKDVADEEPMTRKSNNKEKIRTIVSKNRTRLIVTYDSGDPKMVRQINKERDEEDLQVLEDVNRQMKMVSTVPINIDEEDNSILREIRYYVRNSDHQQAMSQKEQTVEDHLNAVRDVAVTITHNMDLDKNLKDAIIIASKYHDVGKRRKHWQDCMHVKGDTALAKTGHKKNPLNMGGFRHELASIIDVKDSIDDHAEKDLILHLIAAHHGWARPCFKPNALIDYDKKRELNETLRRYSLLQDRFGHWGLAWLESIVRGADWQASDIQDKSQ